MKLIKYSVFSSDPWGNGAFKRTAQIDYLLQKLPVTITNYENLIPDHSSHFVECSLIAYDITQALSLPFLRLKQFFPAKARVEQIYKRLVSSEIKLVIWEYSRYSDNYIPFVCKALKIPIVALPHNLESLVPKQHSFYSHKQSPDWFSEELAILRCCNHIVTISREEQWLLQLHGLKATHLSYHPVPEVESYYQQIREQRSKIKEKNSILLLGTVENPPTYMGFKEIIAFFQDHPELSESLVVAGHKTEQLRNDFPELPENIEIKGTISKAELEDFLVVCKAALIYQQPSTGALTKIPELVAAGIPLIGNTVAFRNFHNIRGIFPFEKIEEIPLLLQRKLEDPEPLSRDQESEQRFLEEVIHTLSVIL